MNRKLVISTVCGVVFLDALAANLVLPLIPFLAIEFEADVRAITGLHTVFALFTFLFAPLIGRLADRHGKKAVFLVSVVLAAFAYIGLAFATTLWMLFLFRALGGIAAAKLSVAQSIITDITDEAERARYIGVLSASISLGFIVGPVIGGLLGTESYSLAFLAAGVFCITSLVVGWLVIPNLEQDNPERQADKAESKKESVSTGEVLSQTRLIYLLPLFFSIAFSNHLIVSIIPIWLYETKAWVLLDVALLMAACGVATIATQVLLVPICSRYLSLWQALHIGIGLIIVSLLGLFLQDSLVVFYVMIMLFSVAVALANNSGHSIVSIRSPSGNVGKMMGINQSVRAVGQLSGPLLAGVVYVSIATSAPFVMCLGLLACTWSASALGRLKQQD